MSPWSGLQRARRGRPWPAPALLVALLLLSGCNDPPAGSTPAGSTPPGPSTAVGEGGEAAEGYPDHGPPPDPVVLNGPIFEQWPKPLLALVITGEQDGYLEPCGCAGRDNQKGGLMRRYSLLAQRRAEGWPLAAVDLGGLVRRFGPQAEIKFQKSIEALAQMQYAGVGLGPADLRLPGDVLLASSTTAADGGSLLIAANWHLTLDETFAVPYRVVDQNGLRLGITAVLGDEHVAALATGDVVARSPAEALAEVVPRLEAESDRQVLLSYASPEQTRALAAAFPQFDVVVTAGGAEEPPREPEQLPGQETLLVEVGHKGMYAAVVAWYDDPDQPWRYQRVPLDSRFPDAPEMKTLLAQYQEELRLTGLETLVGSGVVHPRRQEGFELSGLFAGAKRCQACHPTAYSKWQTTHHAQATATLTKLDPPRQFDPECLSCHVTGWEPQDFLPFQSGFVSLEQTPELAGNSCENCHGPGEEHSWIEEQKTARLLARRDELRAALRRTKATAGEQVCAQCHDHDNSPEFNFEKYWPKVEHAGKK